MQFNCLSNQDCYACCLFKHRTRLELVSHKVSSILLFPDCRLHLQIPYSAPMAMDVFLRPISDIALQSTFTRRLQSMEHSVWRMGYFRIKNSSKCGEIKPLDWQSQLHPVQIGRQLRGFDVVEPSIVVILIALFSDQVAPWTIPTFKRSSHQSTTPSLPCGADIKLWRCPQTWGLRMRDSGHS